MVYLWDVEDYYAPIFFFSPETSFNNSNIACYSFVIFEKFLFVCLFLPLIMQISIIHF